MPPRSLLQKLTLQERRHGSGSFVLFSVPRVRRRCGRHTFATELTARGVPLRAVQELLGHTTIHMTARYAHVAPSTLRAAVLTLVRDTSANAVPNPFGHQVVTNAPATPFLMLASASSPAGIGLS